MSDTQGELDGVEPLPTLSELAHEVAGLSLRVGIQDETLEKVVDYITGPNLGGPWFWPLLSEDQRTKVLRDLADFVLWLDETYLTYVAKYRIPQCWWRHPDARDQLIALMVSHRAVYTKKAKAVSGDLVDWHERALWPVMDRLVITGSMSRCVDEGHKGFSTTTRVRMEEEAELTERIRVEDAAPPEELPVEWLGEEGGVE